MLLAGRGEHHGDEGEGGVDVIARRSYWLWMEVRRLDRLQALSLRWRSRSEHMTSEIEPALGRGNDNLDHFSRRHPARRAAQRSHAPPLCTEQLVPDEELVAAVMRDLPPLVIAAERRRAPRKFAEKAVDVDANYDECVTESPPPLSDEAVECPKSAAQFRLRPPPTTRAADEASPSPPPRQRRGVYGGPAAAAAQPARRGGGAATGDRGDCRSYRDGGGGGGDPVELPSEALSDAVRDAEKVRYEVRRSSRACAPTSSGCRGGRSRNCASTPPPP